MTGRQPKAIDAATALIGTSSSHKNTPESEQFAPLKSSKAL